jgi:hypothetical protein
MGENGSATGILTAFRHLLEFLEGDPRSRAKFQTGFEPQRSFWLCEAALEADDGSRTRDLELGKLALYQLSYVRADPGF